MAERGMPGSPRPVMEKAVLKNVMDKGSWGNPSSIESLLAFASVLPFMGAVELPSALGLFAWRSSTFALSCSKKTTVFLRFQCRTMIVALKLAHTAGTAAQLYSTVLQYSSSHSVVTLHILCQHSRAPGNTSRTSWSNCYSAKWPHCVVQYRNEACMAHGMRLCAYHETSVVAVLLIVF